MGSRSLGASNVGTLPDGAFHPPGCATDSLADMLLAFSISPVAQDPSGSVTEAVAAAVRVVRASGLPHETTSMFTTIEGEWDEVMAVVKQAVDVVAEVSPRVGLVLKADIRPGYDGQLTAKVDRIEQALEED